MRRAGSKIRRANSRLGGEHTQRITSSFERAFAIVDAAVTGAILSGVHPYAFEAVLSYWFLYTAASARGKSSDAMKDWLSGPCILDPILDSISSFAETCTDRLDDKGEQQELNQLKTIPQAIFHTLPELDQRRQSKHADNVVDWVLDVLGRDEQLPVMLVELAFLIEYLKVSAVAGDLDDFIYIVAKQSVPLVWHAYDPVLR